VRGAVAIRGPPWLVDRGGRGNIEWWREGDDTGTAVRGSDGAPDDAAWGTVNFAAPAL